MSDFPTISTTTPHPRSYYATVPFDNGEGLWLWEESAQRWNPVSDAPQTGVIVSTAATGSTLAFSPQIDETILLQSATAAPVAAITLVLPKPSDARVGQIKLFVSDKPITALTLRIGVMPYGSLIGANLTSCAPLVVYSFQCISRVGNGQWLRLA